MNRAIMALFTSCSYDNIHEPAIFPPTKKFPALTVRERAIIDMFFLMHVCHSSSVEQSIKDNSRFIS